MSLISSLSSLEEKINRDGQDEQDKAFEISNFSVLLLSCSSCPSLLNNPA
jgi:hypothetical protein